jgi:hypothetical protein
MKDEPRDLMQRVLRQIIDAQTVEIEAAIQEHLVNGTPLERMMLCWNQSRTKWWIKIITPEELWLDWQSNNHGFGRN